jgi:hypothetical protein
VPTKGSLHVPSLQHYARLSPLSPSALLVSLAVRQVSLRGQPTCLQKPHPLLPAPSISSTYTITLTVGFLQEHRPTVHSDCPDWSVVPALR